MRSLEELAARPCSDDLWLRGVHTALELNETTLTVANDEIKAASSACVAPSRLVRMTSRHVVGYVELVDWTQSLRSRVSWCVGRDGSELDILATELGQLDWQTRAHVRQARLVLENWFVNAADAHRVAPAA